jgi:hypothetical protein
MIMTLGDFRWYIIIECCCHFWTLEYGASRLREHPEGPQSCQLRMLDGRVGDRRRGRPRYSCMKAVQESWTCNWGVVGLVTSHRTRFCKMFLNTSPGQSDKTQTHADEVVIRIVN